MNTHENYVNEKTKYAYNLFLNNRLFEKARAIVVKDDKVVFIKNLKNGNITIPGGGVDEGETVVDAVVREAFEETGVVCEPIKKIASNFYDVEMNYEGNKFLSKRVEYVYLCKFVEWQSGHSGLEGEYEEGLQVFLGEADLLLQCRQGEKYAQEIKNYIEKLNSK